ncbi:baseplate assembly protein [Methylosinus sp. Sm6]|uniref:baseplate assembly protein n=1 Tax=Methylosinus sp. Sm6 TaxID=2866948 RepID=UPI001C9A22AD|nr:baseplate assembly protein [Methylosinus sp. Sm6]MBY6244139.1 baseplate assembly protein [Methylosinus sp. Sm6]
MRVGVDRHTGEVLTGWAECAQSIGVIATTAVGSLVLDRAFGSQAPGLQDRPMTGRSIVDHFMAIAEGLREFEPGFRLRKLGVERMGGDGVIALVIRGDFYPNGHLGDYSLVEPDKAVNVLAALT